MEATQNWTHWIHNTFKEFSNNVKKQVIILSDFGGKQVFTQLIQYILFYCIYLLYSILD